MTSSDIPAERTTAPFDEAATAILRARQIGVRQLARAIGASPSHVSRLLRATAGKQPSLDLVQRVSEALELPADYFLETRHARVVAQLEQRADLVDQCDAWLSRRARS